MSTIARWLMHLMVVGFLYKTFEEALELFEHLKHLHATSSHPNLPRQLESKGGIY